MRLFNRSKIILIVLLTTLSATLNGQSLCFDADVLRGCAPLTINITNCSFLVPDSSILYNYNYTLGDPITGISDTFHTYTTPGLYTVMQIGNINGLADTLIKISYIEVLPAPNPVVSAFRCDSNRVVIKTLNNQYEEYIIDWGDGNSSTIAGLSQASNKYMTQGNKSISIRGNYVPGNCGSTTNVTITTLNTIPQPTISNFTYSLSNGDDSISFDFTTVESVEYDIELSDDTLSSYVSVQNFISAGNSVVYSDTSENGFCYRLKASDACSNEKFSETICTVLLSAEAENNQNVISWDPYVLPINITEWTLFKNSQTFKTFLPGFTKTVEVDTQIICNQSYCYQLTASLFGGVESVSNEVCLKGLTIDTPDAVKAFNVSIEDNQTQLSWRTDTVADIYNLKRGFTRSSVFDSTNLSSFSLAAPLQDIPRICYAIDYYDKCRNLSISTPLHCHIEIKVELTTNENRVVQWLPYEGWPSGAERYFVEKLNENGQVYFSREIDHETFAFQDVGIDTNSQILRYRIKAISNDDDSLISYSLIYEIEQTFRLFFPTAFSPNGDGLNDIFEPIGIFAKEYELLIYNRWGELVFVSKDYRLGWNGLINDKDAPEGVYVFKVRASDELGRTFSEKNSVTLTR